MKLKNLFALIITCVIALALTACGNKETKKEYAGTIKVASNLEFAPFDMVDENGSPDGFDMALIKAFGEYKNYEIIIEDMDFDGALLSVGTGKHDLAIAAITISEDRKQTLDFTQAYYTANQVIIINSSDSKYNTLTTEEELMAAFKENNAKIGCQRGTTGQYYIEGDEGWGFDGIEGTTCMAYDNGAMAVNALKNGQIDAVIIDSAPAKAYCQKFSGVNVVENIVLTEDEEYAICVKKGNSKLLAELNEFITTIKANGKFEEIVGQYFGD